MLKPTILLLVLVFGFTNAVHAQLPFSSEIGIIAGPIAFQSDYGERYDYTTNVNNSGFGVGIVHYFNFSYLGYGGYRSSRTYFKEHFKVRAELSYNKSNFKHYGKYVEKDDNSLGVQQLKAMRGSTQVYNAGLQLEFYPYNIHDFENTDGSFSPFVSLGAQYSYFTPKAYSLLGPLNDPLTTFPKYINATRNDPGTVLSIVGSVGLRHKVSPLSDIMIDMRAQYYFSNWVDGLNPDATKYPENRANDWLVWLNVGYIYYLQY